MIQIIKDMEVPKECHDCPFQIKFKDGEADNWYMRRCAIENRIIEYPRPKWCPITPIELEDAPTIGDWISVKDRLPKKQTPVLVYVPPHTSGQDEYTGYVGMAYYTELGGKWWAGTDGDVYGAIGFIHPPTHWMPRPEPPEEVGRNV